MVFATLVSFGRQLDTQKVKCIYSNNQRWLVRSTKLELHSKKLTNYPFLVTLYKCVQICNILDDLYDRLCFPSITKAVDNKVFNTITERNVPQ